MMGEQDHQPVVATGLDLAPVRAAVSRVHLGEPGFQPAGLIPVEAPGCSAGQAVGIERDEPRGRGVVHVVRGTVQPVTFTEPVPERSRAGPEVGVDEIPPADRPAERTGRDGPAMNASGRVVKSSSAWSWSKSGGSSVGFSLPVSAAARPGVWVPTPWLSAS